MLFAVLCVDKPNHISLRMATRPSHVEFLNGLNAQGILKMAGPFLDDSGKPCGTLSIIETATREVAEVLAQSDPYAMAGLFESVEIRPYNWVFNTPK
jgi:uncharacterized protein